MAYKQKPGDGSLFKNDKKEKDNHPDYKGSAVLPDGTPVWLSAWIKKSEKGYFMSLSIQPKDEKPSKKPKQISTEPAFDDSIPF